MRSSFVAVVAASFLSSAAHASVVIRDFDFTATNFVTGAPYATVNGSVSFAFDNGAAINTPTASGLGPVTLDIAALNVGAPQYVYALSGDTLSIGSQMVTGTCLPFITTSFCLTLSNVSSGAPTARFYYIVGLGSFGSQFAAGNVTLSPHASSAAPEPGAWALMLVGFSLVGYGARRRTRIAAARAA
jgi:opacity protein-like surface antigen